jgi:hypothetical protein
MMSITENNEETLTRNSERRGKGSRKGGIDYHELKLGTIANLYPSSNISTG